ncbi:MAG: hypothetical protein JSU77_13540 [Fidelibacterota bacterium]|nr:MAG: hypothetical protein JSU77_13540 [Candidatus Neomarinimicrobiota bacterium]
MQRKILTSAILIGLIVPVSLLAQRGLTVSFKSRWPVNGTSIGLKLGPVTVYGGLDMLKLSADGESQSTSYGRQWYYDENTSEYKQSDLYKQSESTSEYEGKALLALPHLGFKLYLVNIPLRAYLLGSAFLVVPSVSGRIETSYIDYHRDGTIQDQDSWKAELDESDREQIHDVLDFIGLTLGFGIEYPVSEHFAVGGEYGFSFITNSYHSEDEHIDEYEGLVEWKSEWESKGRTALGITNTSISLNYYF